jgi:hypothetical protein
LLLCALALWRSGALATNYTAVYLSTNPLSANT